MYITTPIYYVNDVPHIGHAYSSLIADVLSRLHRSAGHKLYFVTGTDEHGQKIEKAASKQGVEMQNFVDNLSQKFRDLTEIMQFSNDDFIRTTEDRHKNFVKTIWQKMIDNGYIYKGKYSGWYSVRDEAFYQESDLINGKAPTGAEVEWMEEPSYFFRLSSFQDKLLAFYEQNIHFTIPSDKKSALIHFVKHGLTDLSISRVSTKWGIPVPNDNEHVMYVWLDALFNYISVLGDKYEQFWESGDIIHVIGKDILIFHGIYWPAFLMALDLPLPSKLLVHGWWTVEGEKMSKSIGNIVNPITLIEKFGLDTVRYFLLKCSNISSDSDFSISTLININNSDLVNNIGNLIQRTVALLDKKCNLIIPTVELDSEFLVEFYNAKGKILLLLKNCSLLEILQEILSLSTAANIYINAKAPWKETNVESVNKVLASVLEAIRCILILLRSFIPETVNKILDSLQISERDIIHISPDFKLPAHTKINLVGIVFKKFEE